MSHIQYAPLESTQSTDTGGKIWEELLIVLQIMALGKGAIYYTQAYLVTTIKQVTRCSK